MKPDTIKINEVEYIRKDSLTPVILSSETGPWQIGKNYFIRTVTMIQTGRLVAVTPQELVLEDAAWIADTGRFADALKTGKLNEVEPFPEGQVIIGRGAIIDATLWPHKLPRDQK